MTSYNGALRFDAGGQAIGAGQFAISIAGTMSVSSARLSGGTLSGYTGASGTITAEVWRDDGQYLRDSAWNAVSGIYFAGPFNGFTLPWSDLVGTGLTSYSEKYTYNADRSSIYGTLAATYSGYDSGYYLVGTATASATLHATTSAYSIAALDARRAEGTSGATAYTFSVQRQGSSAGSASASWRVVGSGTAPANGADFAGGILPSGTVFFTSGQTSQTISLSVAADSTIEPDEGFTVTVDQAAGEVMITTPSATGTILNDDQAILAIAPADAVRAEGGSGSTTFTFTANRTGSTAGGASATWTVAGSGTAPASGADFIGGVLPSGTVAFLPGQASRDIQVQVAGDGMAETHEGFTITLSAPQNAVLGTEAAPGTIYDDDSGANETVQGTPGNDVFHLGAGTDTVQFAGARALHRIGMQGGRVRVSGPDGEDDLEDVEFLQFGATAAIAVETLRSQAGTDELMSFITNGTLGYEFPLPYSGPLNLRYVYPGTDHDDVAAGTSFNDFMNMGGGNDAVRMGAGDDIVDGGGGSNFLSGDAGRDGFFLDGRFVVPVWSTITDWEPGETLTLWGWIAGVSQSTWVAEAGLSGYAGATFVADLDGNGAVETAVTWSGRAVADLPTPVEMQVSGIGVLYFA